ncbi:MAG: DUF58 domain-containing protein [Spirochaetes bacterium]|nr:DUF58 domain-containing protein [Spirochaetota bacterium]
MISPSLSLLKKIKIRTHRKMNTIFSGEYRTAFKGLGLAFESVREYQYGDDVRSIDWNVSARMNHLYVKQYTEERELSVVLMVDMSASVDFGTAKSKRELIFEIAALFLYLAQLNNDRITVLLFTDRVEKFIRPRKGDKYVLSILDTMTRLKPVGRGTNIASAVDFLLRVMKKRSVVFLISDFLDEGFELKLKRLMQKHDLIPVIVSDPMEQEMNMFGLAEFVDLETGESFLSEALPENAGVTRLREIDSIRISTAEPFEHAILRYFEKRNRAMRRM